MNKVTIQDIARAANVSKSTVSRVLNGSAEVAESKKLAVLEATERLGFKPNFVARSLASGKSMTIGVMTQLIGSPFYDTIAQGVIAGLNGRSYSPIFVDGQLKRAEEIRAIQALMGRHVDGLILIGGSLQCDEIAELCEGLPTVVVARALSAQKLVSIHMDNVDGGYQATKHLIDQGHRRIAMIQGLKEHADAIDRVEGYRKALVEAGIPFSTDLLLDGDFSSEAGVRGVERLLVQENEFTAIFAANDMTAFGARLALHRHGITVPEQVSIVGFDDQMESGFSIPPLTTIRQPSREMGERATHAVLSMISGETITSQTVTGELILRESVAPPPARSATND
jgi:LacI family transcriptional regulator